MFSVLPTAVQARLPPLQSIRRSVGMRGGGGPYVANYSLSPSPEQGKQALVPHSRSTGDMERLGAQAVVEFVTQGPVLAERASGVDWKCGQQGMRLMDTAIIEANPANAGYSPAFERKAYIDGVSFLLKGLPRDLDESEMIALGSSLPTTFGSMSATGGLPNSASSQAYGERNVLHRSIQTVVVKLFVLLHLIMPYVIFLLRQLAQLERKYKVSENVVGQTIELANAFGRCSVSLSGTIYNMSDGKVGQALANVFAWAIEGVAGGISDGVGEGLARVGARPE